MIMTSTIRVEFLKVLACLAWADEEVTNAELNFIKQFVREFDISGDEWMQVEMYLVEKVEPEEMKQVTRNFLSRIRRPRERRMLVDSVERLLGADRSLTDREREWMQDLQEVVAEGKRKAFVLDGLKSLLRIGGASSDLTGTTRDAELHDFIHNRVLFKLRRRLDPERLEMEGSPAKLKKLTLSAALLGRVGYVDKEFLPREKAFMEEVLYETWGVSLPLAKAVTEIAIEAVTQGADLYRLTKEVKATMSMSERRQLVEGVFALSRAEGRMSHEEIEEIRKIAYMLDLTHRQFIAAKIKVLREC
jgi:uncharacterized tellurite resistance protein B-like protein